MSPEAKSKSKDKLSARAVKEQPKTSLKTSAPTNSGNNIPGSAYNPFSGTFHTLETAPSALLSTPQNNGRFRTIDDTEDHSGSSMGTSADFDSLSNNDSCSGESEDQKEKTTASVAPRTESIPGSDTDKRDKIRQKNERKHQRQKERRSQELLERCSGYLMSRKLEALAQKLVAMGFSSERATMALILNEGRVEESVAWLFEGGDDNKQQGATSLDGSNLKIDIADELAQIAALEIKYKCTKQEVERVVVACEGDLEKAEEVLKAQKQEPIAVPSRSEQFFDPIASANEFNSKLASSVLNSAGRAPMKGAAPIIVQQQRMDERESNYSKTIATVRQVESTNRNLQVLRKTLVKQDWTRPQVAVAPLDKRWPIASSATSVSYPLGSPLQVVVPQVKPEARYAMGGGHEVKTNLQAGTLKEPITVMQRPLSNPTMQHLPSTSIGLCASPPASAGWYPNGTTSIEMMKMAAACGGMAAANVGMTAVSGGLEHQLRSLSLCGSTCQHLYPQSHYQPFVSSPMEPSVPVWSGSRSTPGMSSTRTSSSLAVPSSLGLFTGWGSSGPSGSASAVDWSMGGSMPQCDYTSIDWSLDSTTLTPPALKSNQLYDTWSTTYMGANAARPAIDSGVCLGGLQDGSIVTDPSTSAGSGSHEWTSPFNGKDLFRAPRKFVTSPSL